MRTAFDTNVLIRFFVTDDPAQSEIARLELEGAERLILSITALCEFVWVLGRRYRVPRAEIAEKLRILIEVDKAEFDRGAVEAGLEIMDAGGDFADGVIAFQARDQDAELLVSFDRAAVKRLKTLGQNARLAGTTDT